MDTTRQRAGHLIKAGAVSTCLRCWHMNGRKASAWRKVARQLAELYPAARANSLAAVIRHAMAVAAVARLQAKNGPDYVHPNPPDCRRLIKDRNRERRPGR